MSRNELAKALNKLGQLWDQVSTNPPPAPEDREPLIGKAELILEGLLDEFRALRD